MPPERGLKPPIASRVTLRKTSRTSRWSLFAKARCGCGLQADEAAFLIPNGPFFNYRFTFSYEIDRMSRLATRSVKGDRFFVERFRLRAHSKKRKKGDLMTKVRILISIAMVALFLFMGITPTSADKPTGFDNNGNAVGQTADTGFDQYGYNRVARIFSGTGLSWCQGKLGWSVAQCQAYLGVYTYDKLVMKWNAEWDRGNAEGWNNGPYDAWENNEWNGKVANGSGAVWHYKIVWVGNCVENTSLVPPGGYCIWGQFATIMDQGIDPNYGPGHLWFALANPAGYGFYP